MEKKERDAPLLAVTSGEPAGIGFDLCASIAQHDFDAGVVVIGDPELIVERARSIGIKIPNINLVHNLDTDIPLQKKGSIFIRPVINKNSVEAGKLDPKNSGYVLSVLKEAAAGCLKEDYDAVVTAPVHKGIINDAGIHFTGHTEFFAELTQAQLPVMMLATPGLRVALATTHLPLSWVSQAITADLLEKVILITNKDLKEKFGIRKPRILTCGLNPHAGENGYLGSEEIDTIIPVIKKMQGIGLNIDGPYPADTIFTPKYMEEADCILSMYHDQGLPVLKHIGFGNAVNVTLGLPIIRTSVDHGTALDLAGTGKADFGSMKYALESAIEQIKHYKQH
ncbi:MAG: 4-hydroxythreonine-4-phosphate dehydrogenase PdxA [Gammaproteobacteria bacterium]|nr:MAG: 4-hydroxythreonine-4-phosphate dehydrogenase PdxA [Gammaproteobacteria bacterium]